MEVGAPTEFGLSKYEREILFVLILNWPSTKISFGTYPV
jgi:hypothetical protein